MTAPPKSEANAPETTQDPTSHGVTARAVLIGLALIPLTIWWITEVEYVRYSDNATTSALYFNAVGLLLALMALSALVKRVWPRAALARAELIVIYFCVVVASGLAGHDNLQILFTTLSYVTRNATPENHWGDDIIPHLRPYTFFSDKGQVDALYLGGKTLYEPERLAALATPILFWSVFALVVVAAMLCLGAIFRKQWDDERLNYPIAEVMNLVTSPKENIFRDKVMWAAFASGALLQLLNLAHTLWPTVPGVAIGVRHLNFVGMPLAAANPIPISSFPFSYGLAYLLPLQLSFSIWFFMLWARAETVLAAAAGYTTWRGFPYIQQQGVGAYFGVCLFVLWAARRHLGRVWRSAIGHKTEFEAKEPMPYALAFWGFVVSMVLLIALSVSAGMRLGTAVIFFVVWISLVLTLARIRAEVGLPTIELYQVGADDIFQNVAGTRSFSTGDLTVWSLLFWIQRTHRQFAMQSQMDSFRLADRVGIEKRPVAGLLFGAAALTVVCSFWLMLHSTYAVGFESAKFRGPALWAFGREPWAKLSAWMHAPREPQLGASLAYLFGLGMTLALASLRTRFVWWPFHPIGYLVSGSFGLMRLWVPIFVTWLLKTGLLRYGGPKAYRRAMPFFVGLILGEFAAGFLRTIIDLAFSLYLPASSGIGGL